jgi:hypothetical protein
MWPCIFDGNASSRPKAGACRHRFEAKYRRFIALLLASLQRLSGRTTTTFYLEGSIEIRQVGQSAHLTQNYEVVAMANAMCEA